MPATHRNATSTAGWAKAAPKQGPQRRALYNRCGAKAFLLPDTRKPGNSKYPIVSARSRGSLACQPDCRGIEAARMRARAQLTRGNKTKRKQMRKLLTRANAIGKRGGCRWSASDRR